MATSDFPEISDVLERIRFWSPGMRILLARKVLETLESPESPTIAEPPKTMSLHDVIGVLRTDASAPDDRQCDEIVEQERARKHG